jgi:hypothetical protein
MSASRITTQMPLPPPRLFQLLDVTGPVGWIDLNRVQFTGCRDPSEAAAAACVAPVGLERRRARSSREAPPSLESPRLFLVRRAAPEWITAEEEVLARLVRPNLQDNSLQSHQAAAVSARWFGIEIGFPPDASELTVLSGAQVMYLALRSSRLSWSARMHGVALDVAPVPAARSTDAPRIALQSGMRGARLTEALEI